MFLQFCQGFSILSQFGIIVAATNRSIARVLIKGISAKVALRSGWIARSSRWATDGSAALTTGLIIRRERKYHFGRNAIKG